MPGARPVLNGDWSPQLRKAKVYEQLLVDIVLGALPPGSRLDEQKLVAHYGAGLAGVRDALGRLALEGLVVRQARLGTLVAPLDITEIQQAFEVRYLIEGPAAALAARKATPADIVAITAAFEGAEAAIERRDFRALLVMDQAFHRAVAYATQNLVLARKLVALQNLGARFWIYTLEQRTAEEAAEDVALHRDVARAICARDAGAAERAMIKTIGDAPGLPGG